MQWQMNLQGIVLSEKKSYTLYDSIYIPFSKWKYFCDGEQISGCQVLRLGERCDP